MWAVEERANGSGNARKIRWSYVVVRPWFYILIDFIFKFVAKALNIIAKVTHLTYNEINIIVYYLIIPMSWCVMLDIIVRFPIFTPLWSVLWIYIFWTKRKFFSQWCDTAFSLSQEFLFSFKKIGWDYFKASVIICVLVPIIIYAILIMMLI